MSWGHVRGHDDIIKDFAAAERRGRLAHAYLFVGPAGVGKRRFAGELGKTLLCEGRGAVFGACDRCPSCLQIDAGSHPDWFTAAREDAKQEVVIETVRDLCQKFSLKSSRGRGKVIILDDADELNEESANCFLKTLEEPPAGSRLILVGTSADRQLRTIRSRCQVIRFGPLPPGLVASVLTTEGVEDPSRAAELAAVSAGRPGVGLALADPDVWAFRSALTAELRRPKPDSVGFGKRCGDFIEDAGKETALQRRRAALVLELIIATLAGSLTSTDPGPGDRAERCLELLDRCLDAESQVDRVKPSLVIEAVLDAVARQAG